MEGVRIKFGNEAHWWSRYGDPDPRMKIHATQPKKDDGELAEMSTKYFSRNLLQIAGMAIEIVSISM